MEQITQTKKKKSVLNVRAMVFVALLGALAAVLMSLNFPLPFMPFFLKFDVSDIPALFASFYLGPVSGVIVCVLKVGLELLMTGTETAFVGELTNLIACIMFILPASIIYRVKKTKKSALIGLIVSTAFACIVCIFLNAFISIPMYSSLYGAPVEAIISMCAKTMPAIDNIYTLLAFGILPFNLIKYGITALLTFLLYKKLEKLLEKPIRG